MKRIVMLVLVSCVGVTNAQVIDRIVAVVNADVLTLSELERATVNDLRKASAISDPLARAEARRRTLEQGLDGLISDKLIEQEARQRQIMISEQDVSDRIDGMKNQQRWDDATFQRYLKSQGLDVRALRANIKRQLLNQRIVGQVLGGKVRISESELKDYYREKTAQKEAEFELVAAHILLKIPSDATTADESAVRYRAQQLVARLDAGEPFDALAAKYSEGPAAANGGKLGKIRRGFLEKQLEDAFFGLRAGAYSQPVRSSFGYHVLKVESRRALPLETFEQLAPQLSQELQRERIEVELSKWVKDLRAKSFVEVRL